MTQGMSSSRGPDESFANLFEQAAGGRVLQRRFRVGETVEVTIVAIGREAVFAELGGKQEGVFERIDLGDSEGNLHVQLGSQVSAVVDGIDKGTGQVRLKPRVIRSAEGDVGVAPAVSGSSQPMLVEGARIKGKVTGIERYGVFVQIDGTNGRNGRGLVPVSETATPRGADLKKHFAVGQDVEAKILNIDESGKIRLSISALGADDERGMFEAYKASQGKDKGEAPAKEGGEGAPRSKEKAKPAPRGFGTLGDLLAKSKTAVEPKAAAPATPPAAPQKGDARDAKPAAPGRRVMVDPGASGGPKSGGKKR
jgi:small subunit ribosomal protein S1